jgi:hypothetical protein
LKGQNWNSRGKTIALKETVDCRFFGKLIYFATAEETVKSETKFLVDVLVNTSRQKDGEDRVKAADPIAIDEPGEPVVAGVSLTQVRVLFL